MAENDTKPGYFVNPAVILQTSADGAQLLQALQHEVNELVIERSRGHRVRKMFWDEATGHWRVFESRNPMPLGARPTDCGSTPDLSTALRWIQE